MAKDHRIFAAVYDRLGRADEHHLGERRRSLLADARGRVIEIGAGTGLNLPHYSAADHVTLTEPDRFMRGRLKPRLGQAPFEVELVAAGAERLPFPDQSFDTAVSTLVLCSVESQDRALAEIRRVLRPGGQLLFLEHVRGGARTARWQDRLTPVWSRLGGGCHPNRDTVAAIRRAGFELDHVERFSVPGPISRLLPHVMGRAHAFTAP